MKFGEFDDQNYEYIIHRPDTPLPWINYLGCQDYFGIISNTAGGYSFYRDARLRRLTRYRYNNIPFDANGRYLYLRDRANGEFWSPTWQPVRKSLDVYECRHGLGYSTIASQYKGISVQIRYFVPLDENLEIWQVTVTNTRAQAAAISLFSFVEFCLWDALDDASNFQRNFSTGEVEVEDGVIYHKTEYRERRDHFAFFACSEKINGFDTQRQDFLGAYRGLEAPQVVEQGNCNNSIAHGWAPVGVHQVDLDLAGGETRNLVFLLGYQENALLDKFDPPGSNCINKRAVKTLIERYTQPSQVQAAFERLSDYWRQLVGVFQVQTPDVHTNRMVNIWNAYQCMVTFNMSRSASFFESGIGRGMGFRDTTQDMLGFVHMAPERARQRLLDVAATHLESGGAYHQYQPLTKRGNDAVGTNFNDDPLWLVLAVAAYLKESADWSILQEQVPYDNRPGSEQPLLEHLQRCIRYTLQRLGPHGLPLIGRADWNDCLNLNAFSTQSGESFQTTTNKDGKVAESVFIAGLFVLAAHEMAEISTRIGDMSAAQAYLEEAAKMEQTTLQHGWDGSWFLRAYDDFGKPVGSHTCEEGQIFIEPQGICVLAGIGLFSGQAQQALDSVSERLVTQHGIVLHQPPYTRYYLNLGEISTYPPGYKENAGVFCHTNPWIMIGETRLGRGEQALVHYLRINPSAREAISEIHKTEPYVYAQMIAGKDAPSHGEAKNSWLSGTAAWNYVAISQWILGVRPHYDGLLLAPVVPPAWQSFRMQRVFRHTVYDISVNRQGPGNQVSIRVNDKPVDGNLIAPQPGCKLDVEVTLF